VVGISGYYVDKVDINRVRMEVSVSEL